jgi:hypothetical protein
MRVALIFILFAAAAAACSDPPAEPTATVLSAAPEALVLGDDTRNDLTIVIAYEDGDGDLGHGTARIHDCRADGVVSELALPSIASEDGVDEGVAITGELELRLNDVGDVTAAAAAPAACAELGAPAPAADQVVFCVVLVDAAGTSGEGDCTAAVALSHL